LPEELEGKDEDVGAHCWAEFFIPGTGWIPVDVSYGDTREGSRNYYFGNLDERRVSLSYGRDILLHPPQEASRLPFFVRMYCEIDGKPHDMAERRLRYWEIR
jgi:transglutaminase-like putative cysteine protease